MATVPTFIVPAMNFVFQSPSTFQGLTSVPPDNSVTDTKIPAAASGSEINPTKIGRRIDRIGGQGGSAVVATGRETIHVVKGATATLVAFKAGLRLANAGTATVTVDLLKNGASILTGVITLDNTVANFAQVAGAFASTGLVVGDVLEVNWVATAGGGTIGKGLFYSLDGTENSL
jgi:hypothetical protein